MSKKKEIDYSCVADPEILKFLGPSTKSRMRRESVHVAKEKKKYKKRPIGQYNKDNAAHVLAFTEGCNLLQYSIVVRPFIIRKYNIENPVILDALLYVYPIQYFTRADFDELLLKYHSIYAKTMIELGFFKVAIPGNKNDRRADIFTLSDHAVNLVQDYYMYLAGEKTIEPNNYTNPYKSDDVAKIDKMREELMIKLKSQTKSAPSYYTKQLQIVKPL